MGWMYSKVCPLNWIFSIFFRIRPFSAIFPRGLQAGISRYQQSFAKYSSVSTRWAILSVFVAGAGLKRWCSGLDHQAALYSCTGMWCSSLVQSQHKQL